MAISSGGGGRKIRSFNEINITPLTDIFLVLLIMMMVLAPMFQQQDRAIVVPTIKAGSGMEEDGVIIEITKDGQLKMDGKTIPKEQLTQTFKRYTANNKNMTLVVRADEKANGESVMDVFDAAGDSGFKRLTIAGEPANKEKIDDKLKDLPLNNAEAE